MWVLAGFLRNWIRSVLARREFPWRPSLGCNEVRWPQKQMCRAPHWIPGLTANALGRSRGAGWGWARGVLTDPSSSRGAAQQ